MKLKYVESNFNEIMRSNDGQGNAPEYAFSLFKINYTSRWLVL